MRTVTLPRWTDGLGRRSAILNRCVDAFAAMSRAPANERERTSNLPAFDCLPTLSAALLTNFVAPYRVGLLEAFASRVGHLKVFVSTTMEPDRAWKPQHGRLDLVVQRTLTFRREHRRPGNIRQLLFIHVPLDTVLHLLRYRPRLVISGEMGMRSLQAVIYRRLCPQTRLILWATLSEHTEKDWGWCRRTLRRSILRSVDAVIVNGPSGARYVEGLRPGTRTHVVNQAVLAEPFASAPLHRRPEDARRLIFSGRLIAQKGVFELQRAIADRAARHPAEIIRITWAGDGIARQALEAACMPPSVHQHFTGHLDYAELARVYAGSGALVLPTLFDEWGLVVNEALASGLPVLGSIFSQAVEVLVEDGVTGWLFDPTGQNNLEHALDRFLTLDGEQLASMRAAARRRALQVTVADAADRMAAAARQVFGGDAWP